MGNSWKGLSDWSFWSLGSLFMVIFCYWFKLVFPKAPLFALKWFIFWSYFNCWWLIFIFIPWPLASLWLFSSDLGGVYAVKLSLSPKASFLPRLFFMSSFLILSTYYSYLNWASESIPVSFRTLPGSLISVWSFTNCWNGLNCYFRTSNDILLWSSNFWKMFLAPIE